MPIIHWFRRDFRLHDNAALWHACHDSRDGVIPVFIFDDAILRHPDCGGPIVRFMLDCLAELRQNLRNEGGDLLFLHGTPVEQLHKLAIQTKSSAIYYNKDYAPGAVERDEQVERELGKIGLTVKPFKDQVIFEEQEILTKSGGEPYTVYTPYKNAWLKQLQQNPVRLLSKPKLTFPPSLKKVKGVKFPAAGELGHSSSHHFEIQPGESAARKQLAAFCRRHLANYEKTRNFPAIDGTSRLSPHLRHGTLSPRQCIDAAMNAGLPENSAGADTWTGEFIWRDFFQQVLFNFPHVESKPFKKNMRRVKWRKSQTDWYKWAEGNTGYPIVDAGMRQLNQTGWMHNRLRMIVAMFLTKDLLLDYHLGERYFMQNLIDGETAQNNGNWQWSASTGTDAQPYFRIFNPVTQSEKFDPDGTFIRRYCPELAKVPNRFIHWPCVMSESEQRQSGCRMGVDYPLPMVDHDKARDRAISVFKAAR